jgi:hypothetical protein
MDNVQFQEEENLENFRNKMADRDKKVGGISALVIKSGLAKNKSQANIVLVSIIIVCWIIAGIFLYSNYRKNNSTSIPDLYKNLSEKQKSQLPEAFRQALERQSGLK